MAIAKLTLFVLQDVFAICRLEPTAPIPAWALSGFCSITRTEDELSIVCPQVNVPLVMPNQAVERGWRCLKVAGPLNFSLTGILSAIAAPLAESGISLFAVSTYETDYLLVKQQDLEPAIRALSQVGHRVESV